MAKPKLKPIATMDALVGGNVSAVYTGSLPYSNKLEIFNAETLASVWSETISSHVITECHLIPANVLTNGKKYCAAITFYDVNGTASETSDKAYFYCLKTPTFYLTQDGVTQIQENDEVKTSTLHLEVVYSQANNDELAGYRFTLYDSEKNQLSRSALIYDTDGGITYDFKGVNNRETYYVRAEGQTRKGIDCDTGLVKVFINYTNPSNYARVYVKSDKYSVVNGYTNVNLIEPDDPDPNNYEFDGSYVILTNRDIVYSGLSISGDFTLTLKVKNVLFKKELFRATSENNGEFYITTMFYENKVVFKLTVDNGICNYILYSEPLEMDDDDIAFIYVRRIKNVYQMHIIVNGVDETEKDLYLSMHYPTGTIKDFSIWINTDTNPMEVVEKTDRVTYYQTAEPTNGATVTKVDLYEKTGLFTGTATLAKNQVWIQ